MASGRTSVLALLALVDLSTAVFAATTVCNEAPAIIHLAFADVDANRYTTDGWFSVSAGSCSSLDFTPSSSTLFFTADSDPYRVANGSTVVTHWGNQVELYVSDKYATKFTYHNAQQSRGGSKLEKFQTDALSVAPEKLVGLTIHIKAVGSSVDITSKK